MRTDSRPQLSLFLPFWNELEVLEATVQACVEALSTSGLDWELLLVDDGSTDGSERLSERLAGNGVRVFHHPTNRGYGAALATGFAEARGHVIAYTDADLPVDIQRFVDAFPLMAEYDLVIGHPIDRDEGLRRAIYTAGYLALVRLALGLSVQSINFAFKMARRTLVEQWTLDVRGGVIDAQILLESKRAGARVHEVPVEYYERQAGESKFDNVGAVLNTVRELAGVALRYRGRP
jgi:glycosyltransferase involved in cell wall biosynthesis